MQSLRKLLFIGLVATLTTSQGWAEETQKAQEVVDSALETLKTFNSDPEMDTFRTNLNGAQGVLIVPSQVKGAFIFGASGGSGTLLARDKSGQWSPPAFYNLGSVSFGLQAGGEKSEVILLVMTEKGVDSMLTSKVQLGADLKVAVGGAGGGGQVATADVISFARSKGAFAGVSLDGAIVSPKKKLNQAYYGEEVSPADILVRRSVEPPSQASALVDAVAQAASSE